MDKQAKIAIAVELTKLKIKDRVNSNPTFDEQNATSWVLAYKESIEDLDEAISSITWQQEN